METKIEGLKIAQGKVFWAESEKKSDDSGYRFSFESAVDQAKLDSASVTMDALMDCVSQLEEMPEDDLKKAIGYRKDQGPMNAGLVIPSTLDPRIAMSVSFGDPNDKKVGFNVEWFLSTESKDMGAREVSDADLNHVEQLRKETPEMEQDEIEKLLGLELKAEDATTVRDLIRTTKTTETDQFETFGLVESEERPSPFRGFIQRPAQSSKDEFAWELASGVDGWGLPLAENASEKHLKVRFYVETPQSSIEGTFVKEGLHDDLVIKADEIDLAEGKDEAVLAAEYIQNFGKMEPSASQFHTGVFYTTAEGDLDHTNDAVTTYSFFLEGFSKDEEKKVWGMVTGKEPVESKEVTKAPEIENAPMVKAEALDRWGMPVLQESAGKKVVTYFQVVTPESAEIGDFEETGLEDEVEIKADETDLEDGLDDAAVAADYIKKNGGSVAPSSTAFHTGVWYQTIDGEENYKTGATTTYTYHLKGFSPEEEKKVWGIVTGKSEDALISPEKAEESVARSSGKTLAEMARQVTDEIAAAFMAGKSKKVKNTSTDGVSIFLHGNEIVKKDGKKILITDAGWPTVTTRERINGVLAAMGISAKVSQKRGEQTFDGKPWDGKWIEAGSAPALQTESRSSLSDRAEELLKKFISKVDASDAAADVVKEIEIDGIEYRYGGREVSAHADDKTFIWDVNSIRDNHSYLLFDIMDADGKSVSEDKEETSEESESKEEAEESVSKEESESKETSKKVTFDYDSPAFQAYWKKRPALKMNDAVRAFLKISKKKKELSKGV